MNLQLSGKYFLIIGATSGFGNAVTRQLVSEGAIVIAVARSEDKLNSLASDYPSKIIPFAADITLIDNVLKLSFFAKDYTISGVLINAGGPPAMKFVETTLADWDTAYNGLVRWKTEIIRLLLPQMLKNNFGRFVFIESAAVKQPIENLILSNSLRLAVVGLVKTVSQEYANSGVTFNILAPGYHKTQAITRLIKKKSEQLAISEAEAENIMIKGIPVGEIGNAHDFASLALWIFSSHSSYITGQTFSVDGGIIRGIFG